MRTLICPFLVLGLFVAASPVEATRYRPMPRAQAVLGKALGLHASKVRIEAALPLRPDEQLVRFSVVVPSIFSNAGVAYVGTAKLKKGRDGKAQRVMLGRLDIHGTGVFSGLYEQVRGRAPTPTKTAATLLKKAIAPKQKALKPKGATTPWGTLLK